MKRVLLFTVIVFTLILACGNKTILESTHKKNINGDWIPDSTKTISSTKGD